MCATTAHLVVTFVMVMVSFANIDFLPDILFLDDNGLMSDLSFASVDSSLPNVEEMFENEVAPDLALDLSIVSADSSSLEYFQLDDISEYWDEEPSTLSADAENPECVSGGSRLSARLRARAGAETCVSPYNKDPPTVFDLSNPNLKLRPICPMAEYPMLPIAVCSSGNPLDVWGPLNNFLLYDSEQGESIYTPSFPPWSENAR